LRLAGVTPRQYREWEKQGFIRRSESFEFGDILALKTLKKLREMKIPASRIRQAIDSLLGWLEDVQHPLSQLRITAEGKRITVHLSGRQIEAVTGQLLLDFEGREFEKLRTLAAKPPRPNKGARRGIRTLVPEGFNARRDRRSCC